MKKQNNGHIWFNGKRLRIVDGAEQDKQFLTKDEVLLAKGAENTISLIAKQGEDFTTLSEGSVKKYAIANYYSTCSSTPILTEDKRAAILANIDSYAVKCKYIRTTQWNGQTWDIYQSIKPYEVYDKYGDKIETSTTKGTLYGHFICTTKYTVIGSTGPISQDSYTWPYNQLYLNFYSLAETEFPKYIYAVDEINHILFAL